jgi:hypothetical protein
VDLPAETQEVVDTMVLLLARAAGERVRPELVARVGRSGTELLPLTGGAARRSIAAIGRWP